MVAGVKDEVVVVEASGREVPISSPDKVFFAERGDTKLALVRYYQSVEEPLLAAMGGRPVLLQRFPNGAGGPSFFQKRVPESHPDWLQTTIVSTPNGTTSRALVAADLAHVLWAVNLACLGFHVWPSQASDPEHADELRIDLDPTPGVTFPMVQEAAHEVRSLLDEAPPCRRPPAIAASTCTCAYVRSGPPTRSAPPRWRWRASSSGGART